MTMPAKLPEEGGGLIFCASYNGGAAGQRHGVHQMAARRCREDALARCAMAVFGCGNSDWAATYQSDAALRRRALAARGARSLYARGEAMRGAISTASSKMVCGRRACAMKEWGLTSDFSRSADDQPLYKASGWRRARSMRSRAWRRGRDEGAHQRRASDQERAQVRPSAPRGTSRCNCRKARATASATISAWCAQRSGSGRCRRAPLRLSCRRQIRLQVAEGRSRATAGRRQRFGRPVADRFVDFSRFATRKQIQIMAEQTRCPVTKPKLLAFVDDDAEAGERYRAESWPRANRCSISSRNIRPANCRSTFISKCSRCSRRGIIRSRLAVGRCSALQRHRRRSRRAGHIRTWPLQGHLLQLSQRPPRGRYGLCERA